MKKDFCERCTQYPKLAHKKGTLYIKTGLFHSTLKLTKVLKNINADYTLTDNKVICLTVDNNFKELIKTITPALSILEQQDTRTFFEVKGLVSAPLDYLNTQTLYQLISIIDGEWLIDLMEQQKLTIFFQPIFDRNKRVYAHECLLRGIQGKEIISPGIIFDVAHKADLIFQLDSTTRKLAIQEAGKHEIKSKIFINFVPTSIYDPNFCLKTMRNTLGKTNLKNEQLVFEVVESDKVTDVNHLNKILKYYRDHNFKIALDDLGSGHSTLNLLSELKPDYVKLDLQLVRNVDIDNYKATITKKIIEVAKDLGITVIAEGIESVGESEWLIEHGADLLQGFLYAKPQALPYKRSSI
ncbi:MAG: eal domain protein [Francisellaceae bacterium]|nr:eal domain protein [Francisellaceae bacterium]